MVLQSRRLLFGLIMNLSYFYLMEIEWRFKSFEDLTKTELHEMMVLRQQGVRS